MSHRLSTRRRGVGALATAVAANLALATVVAGSQAGPSYLAVGGWSADTVGPNLVRLTATTNGAIPKRADQFINDNVIVGIAWADFGTGTALVATIHPTLGRDSNQRPRQLAPAHRHARRGCRGAKRPVPRLGRFDPDGGHRHRRQQDDAQPVRLEAARPRSGLRGRPRRRGWLHGPWRRRRLRDRPGGSRPNLEHGASPNAARALTASAAFRRVRSDGRLPPGRPPRDASVCPTELRTDL